jgi:hypothetical protein
VINVLREDHRNRNLLFVGTESGVFVSINGGKSWTRLMNKLPTVAIQDLVIHPRDFDLIAGTHGRSIWILDDITPLQQVTEEVLASGAHLFENRPATLWENVSRGGQRGHFWFAGENPPTIVNTSSVPRAEFTNTAFVTYYLKSKPVGSATLNIRNIEGSDEHTVELPGEPGIHRYRWDLRFDPPPLTEDQRQRVEQTFGQLMQRVPFWRRRLERARDRFHQAQTPREEREAIEFLVEGLPPPMGLGPEYGFVTADPGSYFLELNVDGKVYRSTLTIRADPLLSKVAAESD